MLRIFSIDGKLDFLCFFFSEQRYRGLLDFFHRRAWILMSDEAWKSKQKLKRAGEQEFLLNLIRKTPNNSGHKYDKPDMDRIWKILYTVQNELDSLLDLQEELWTGLQKREWQLIERYIGEYDDAVQRGCLRKKKDYTRDDIMLTYRVHEKHKDCMDIVEKLGPDWMEPRDPFDE